MTITLSSVIEAYFASSNAADSERLANIFAAEGKVRDEATMQQGCEAIAVWARDGQARHTMQAEPSSIACDAELSVVTARITGAFPGSPLDPAHRFLVTDGSIQALEVDA